MAETSRPWNGTTVGDATAAPYNAPDEWAEIYRSLAGADGVPTNLSGVFRGSLNQLAVSGLTSPVSVATGRALVHGTWYKSDASSSVTIPTPSSATRLDRIVVRKNWSAQTVRITRIAGVEGGPAPSLVQTDGVNWDMPLAQVSITTGGVVSVVDQREFIPRHGNVSGEGSAAVHAIGQLTATGHRTFYSDAAGALQELTHGSAGQVLTSQGAGSAPAWAGNPRALWVPVSFVTGTSAVIQANDNNLVGNLTGNNTGDAHFSFPIPAGFTTLTKAAIISYTKNTSGNLRYQVDTNWGAAGESNTANTDSIAASTLAMVTPNITEVDVSPALTGIAAGDRVGMRFRRLGADVLDTIDAIYVLGLLLEYS